MAIPKIIHYVWVGEKAKPELFYRCLESWKKYCPDYKIIEWNETNFDINQSLFASQAYQAKKYGFVPDYIRAKVLYDYGGIYMDTDVELTKPLDDLLDNDFLISFENEAYLETAFLGSVKGHPFLNKMCKFYETHPFICGDKMDLTPSTPVWTLFLKKYYGLELKNKNQILYSLDGNHDYSVSVYNNEYFCPINFTTKEINVTQNTYAIHYFDASWFTKELKRKEKFLKAVYKIFGKRMFAGFTKMYLTNVKLKYKEEI